MSEQKESARRDVEELLAQSKTLEGETEQISNQLIELANTIAQVKSKKSSHEVDTVASDSRESALLEAHDDHTLTTGDSASQPG